MGLVQVAGSPPQAPIFFAFLTDVHEVLLLFSQIETDSMNGRAIFVH